MLRESELRALAELQEPATVSELAERLDWSNNHTSEVVTALEGKGLVRKHRVGKTKRITPSESKAVELYHDLAQRFGHVDLPALLSGPTVELLYYLDEPLTVAELADRTDNYRNTVNRRVKRLRDHGILRKDDSRYVLTDEFALLHRFTEEYVHLVHRQRAAEVADGFSILWEDHDSFLLQTDDRVADEAFRVTGPERFDEYGLPLLATETRYYVYPADALESTAEELVCHMLVIDSGPRFRSYCLLLLTQVEVDEHQLRHLGGHYGVADAVEELLSYLATDGEESTPEMPAWNEFRALAADYGVSV